MKADSARAGLSRATQGGVVVAALILAACTPSPSLNPSAGASGQPVSTAPVTINTTTAPSLVYAPIYVGVEKGIFLKHGIDLKVTVASSGTQAVAALQSGQAQFIAVSWSTLLGPAAQGVPVQAFAMVNGTPEANYDKFLAMVVRPGINAKSAADLKGLKIGLQLGGPPEIWVRGWLRRAGLKPTDVTLQNAPLANFLSLLQTSAVDAVVGTEPTGTLIQAQLPGSQVLLQGGGLVEARIMATALRPWLQQNADEASRLIGALLEAAQYTRQNPDEAAAATGHYLSGIEPNILATAMKKLDFDPRWSAKIETGLTEATQQQVESGQIKTSLSTQSLLALDLLTTAQDKYRQYFSDLK